MKASRGRSKIGSEEVPYSADKLVKFFSLQNQEDKSKYYSSLQLDTVNISKSLRIGDASERGTFKVNQ